MSEASISKTIRVADILLDVENPRLPSHASDQPSAIQLMAHIQGKNLVGMATHLLDYGPSPVDLPIVMPNKEISGSFIVLDGNRRITTIKVLETPSLIEGVVAPSILKQIKKLGERYVENPISALTCYVVSSRAEADPWIQNRHRGLRGGSGLNEWDGYVAARYDALTGEKSVALQAVDFVISHADLSKEAIERIRMGSFPVTTLERILKTPYVRQKLGINIVKGELLTKLPTDEVVKGIARLVDDVGSGAVTVTDVKKVDQRIKYIDGFSVENLPNLSKQMDENRILDHNSSVEKKKRKYYPKPHIRATLIPVSLHIDIKQHRLNAIFNELKNLSVDSYPNSVSVLFRVFLELSLDHFLENVMKWEEQRVNGAKLANKLKNAIDFLMEEGVMTKQQLAPAQKAADGHTLIAASVRGMHAYVHNRHMSAIPSELKTAWDDLQLFIVNLWC